MKKISIFILLGVLLIISTQKVSALEDKSWKNSNNITITEENFLKLMDAGYTIDEINSMNQTSLSSALSTNREGSVSKIYLKTTTRNVYGKITTETEEITESEYKSKKATTKDYDEPIIGQGTSGTAYKMMTTTVYTYDSTLKRIKNYMYWKEMPTVRSYDIIGAAHQPYYVYKSLGPNFRQLYTHGTTTYVESVYYPKELSTGVGALFELPSVSISTLCQEISYLVGKQYPDEQVENAYAVGDYVHATVSVSPTLVNQNYTVNHVVGINLDASIYNSYDNMPISEAYFNWY